MAMMRYTHRAAGDECSQAALVKCHGPGTPAEDTMEGQAVAKVFGEKGVSIGSFKPNMGHSEGPSGVTSYVHAVDRVGGGARFR